MRRFAQFTLALLFGFVLFAAACSDPQAIVDEAITKLEMPENVTASMTKIEPTLPDEAKYNDITISISSSNQDVIKNDGTIIRSIDDKNVTITVTLTLNGKTASKEFEYRVTADPALITAYLEDLIDDVSVPGEVTENLSVIDASEHPGVSVRFECSDSEIVTANGTVNRPLLFDKEVTVNVILTKNNISKNKEFTVVVKGREGTDEEYVDADIAGLMLIGSAIGDIELPTEGTYGTIISWASSNTDRIANDGTVTRGTSSSTVTLTATVSKGEVSKEKKINVTVLGTDNNNNGVYARATKLNPLFWLTLEDGEVYLTYEGYAFVNSSATSRTIEFALDHTPSPAGGTAPRYDERSYNDEWFDNLVENDETGMKFKFKVNVSEAYKELNPGGDWIKFFVKVTETFEGVAEPTVTFLRSGGNNWDGLSNCVTGGGADNWPSNDTGDLHVSEQLTDKYGNTYVINVNWGQIHLRKG